ncbi:MAG: hypothetical protein WC229_03225 [Candidatus Paceibacterota bacterium]|jgi:hypothetical protein
MNEQIIWHTLEYKKREKTTDWYWAVIIIAISIVIISIMMDNVLFAILVVLAVTSLLMFSNREPVVIEVEISGKGVRVEKELYPFISLEAFWVDAIDEDEPKIILKSKKVVMPLIVIPIDEYNHEDIRLVLLDKLEEKELHEPLPQKIMAKLGF